MKPLLPLKQEDLFQRLFYLLKGFLQGRYAITNGQHYAFAEINSRDIRTETSKYLAFTIVDTDWDTFEVFIGPEMMSVDPVSIKLPTITRFIEGLSSIEDLGKGMAAGLPNITGTVGV